MTEWSQAEAEARAAETGFLWCPAFPFHAHTWRLAAWWCKRRGAPAPLVTGLQSQEGLRQTEKLLRETDVDHRRLE